MLYNPALHITNSWQVSFCVLTILNTNLIHRKLNSKNLTYKVWSKSSETDFFTRLWVHFGTPLFAGCCPRTPSLSGTRDGPSTPLSPLWVSVEESHVPTPCYCSCCAGCRKSKGSACAPSFVWNWEEMVQRHLKCWELPSVSSVWAALAFSNGTRDLKKAKTQLMTIRGLADRRQAKLTTVFRECENWSK